MLADNAAWKWGELLTQARTDAAILRPKVSNEDAKDDEVSSDYGRRSYDSRGYSMTKTVNYHYRASG